MHFILKLLASKITGKIGTRIGIAIAKVIVQRTKTKLDDEVLIELGLMEQLDKGAK